MPNIISGLLSYNNYKTKKLKNLLFYSPTLSKMYLNFRSIFFKDEIFNILGKNIEEYEEYLSSQLEKYTKDIIFWNIDALATTRPRTIESNAAYSNHLLIPHQLQVATYLAETSFPSAITGSMGMAKRETSFGDNVAQVVRPVTRHISDGRIIGLDHSDLGFRSLALWAPDVWQHGYVFDDNIVVDSGCDGR